MSRYFYFALRSGRLVATGATFTALAFLFGFQPATVNGQGSVGSTRGDYGVAIGKHTIKGTIHLGDGAPLNGRSFRVRLESTDQSTRNTNTDPDGSFIFSSVPAGNWTVVVEGTAEYESAREPAPIDRSAGGPVNIVDIFVKRKISSDPAFAGIPRPALEAYSKGLEALGKKDDKKALENFDKAVGIYPNFAQALTEMGAIYIRQKEYDKAIDVLKKAVSLKPDSFDAHYNYASALYAKKDLATAEQEYRTAIKLRESSALAHFYLGLLVVGQKKYDEARQEFEKAVNLPGGDGLWQAHRYLGGIYMSIPPVDPKRAADELEKYLQLQPNASDAEKTRATIKDLRARAGSSGSGMAN